MLSGLSLAAITAALAAESLGPDFTITTIHDSVSVTGPEDRLGEAQKVLNEIAGRVMRDACADMKQAVQEVFSNPRRVEHGA